MQGMVHLCDQMLLAPGNFLKRRNRFHQSHNHRALRDRDGGKVNIGCFDHARIIAKSPNKSTQNQPDHSLCRSRWAYFQRLYLTPIQTRK